MKYSWWKVKGRYFGYMVGGRRWKRQRSWRQVAVWWTSWWSGSCESLKVTVVMVGFDGGASASEESGTMASSFPLLTVPLGSFLNKKPSIKYRLWKLRQLNNCQRFDNKWVKQVRHEAIYENFRQQKFCLDKIKKA